MGLPRGARAGALTRLPIPVAGSNPLALHFALPAFHNNVARQWNGNIKVTLNTQCL